MSRPTSCPEPAILSELADDATRQPGAARHAAECPRCAAIVRADRLLAGALARSTCPDAETLAAFVDETLAPERLDRTAAHVLACEPCREVVGWIREAYAAGQDREESLRRRGRRRPLRARARGPQAWLPALAAAAAILLIAAFTLRSGAPERGRDPLARSGSPARPGPEQPERERAPRPDDARQIPEPIEPEARATPTVEPEPPADLEPLDLEPLDLAASDPAEPRQPAEASDPRREPATSERAAEPPAEVAVALAAASPRAGQTLLWEHVELGGPRPLGERRELPAGARLSGHGELVMGGAECTLWPGAEVAVRAGELELIAGTLDVEAPPEATLAVAHGGAKVRPGAEGGLYQAAIGRAGAPLLLFVIDGAAELEVGGGRHAVAAGEGREVDGERVRPTRASEQTLQLVRARSLEVPRGIAARAAVEAAAPLLSSGDLAARAQAVWTIVAAATDPHLPLAGRDHADAASAALEALAAEDPAALAASGAAAPVILARALAATPGASPELSALVEALAARPAAELAGDADRLAALRAGARLTGLRLPRELWVSVAAALTPDTPAHDLARALLVQPRQDPARQRSALEALDAALQQDPAREPLEPAQLARIELALGLAGAWTPERLERVALHAAWARREPALARALSAAGARALGLQPPAPRPASVVARPLGDGRYRVTFHVRSTRRPRAIALYGSWNEWSEQAALPLRRQPDGSFVGTLTLPAGRYAYKLRLENGRTWEVDGDNPLREADGRGGENSVLLLE